MNGKVQEGIAGLGPIDRLAGCQFYYEDCKSEIMLGDLVKLTYKSFGIKLNEFEGRISHVPGVTKWSENFEQNLPKEQAYIGVRSLDRQQIGIANIDLKGFTADKSLVLLTRTPDDNFKEIEPSESISD